MDEHTDPTPQAPVKQPHREDGSEGDRDTTSDELERIVDGQDDPSDAEVEGQAKPLPPR